MFAGSCGHWPVAALGFGNSGIQLHSIRDFDMATVGEQQGAAIHKLAEPPLTASAEMHTYAPMSASVIGNNAELEARALKKTRSEHPRRHLVQDGDGDRLR